MDFLKPIKVMFVNQSARMGGAEKVLLDFLRFMDRKVILPVVVLPSGELSKKIEKLAIQCINVKEFDTLGSTRKNMNFKDSFQTFSLVNKLNNIIKDIKPDIIYTNSVKAHILINYKKRPIPSFLRLHDYPSSFNGISKLILKNALKNADVVSGVSKSVTNNVEEITKKSKKSCQTCYNGIEPRQISHLEHFHRPRIVIAGWLLEWKGFDIFIDAMESVAYLLPDWDFVIAGAPANDAKGSIEYSESLHRKIASSKYKNRFVVHGRYNSLDEIVCCANHCIFIQPSLKPDPLPTVILESSNLKLPVVASNLGGSKEIIKNNFSGKLIYPSPEEIANAVLELAHDANIRLEYGENLYRTCMDMFSMDNYVQNITTSIQNLTNHNEG